MLLTRGGAVQAAGAGLPKEADRLTPQEFALISNLARQEIGLELGRGKEELVSARLGKLMRKLNCRSFREYHRYVVDDRTGGALIELIDSLTTNHTSFFREPAHFDFLRERVIPEWRGMGRFNIWSAACSTGEEPYSIALAAMEQLGPKSNELPSILATDISTRVLETAQRGLFKAERFGATLQPWLRKHLLVGQGNWEGWYRIKPQVSALIEFRRMNLIQMKLPSNELRFAAIFCRNVMIYFSRETQERLVNELSECLAPGGYLMVGHSESLTGIKHPLESVRPAVYRKRGDPK